MRYFSTLEEKFRISERPCNIFYTCARTLVLERKERAFTEKVNSISHDVTAAMLVSQSWTLFLCKRSPLHRCWPLEWKRSIGAPKQYTNSVSIQSSTEVRETPRGGGVLLDNSWWGRAARLFTSWPHFRPKNVIFHTRFQTRPLKSIPVFRPGFRQNLCYHYIDYSANKKLFKFISNLYICDLLSIDSVILIIETCNCLPFSYSRSIFQGDTSHDKCWK